jgi:hypothetical protein
MAKRAVKALVIGDLGKLACLNSVQDNALLLTPFAQAGTDKFGAIIGTVGHGTRLSA